MAAQKKKKIFVGKVISNKQQKTIVAQIDRVKTNTKYEKQYLASTKFKVHDELEEYEVGDQVKFIGCRPLSKEKKWRALPKKNSVSKDKINQD